MRCPDGSTTAGAPEQSAGSSRRTCSRSVWGTLIGCWGSTVTPPQSHPYSKYSKYSKYSEICKLAAFWQNYTIGLESSQHLHALLFRRSKNSCWGARDPGFKSLSPPFPRHAGQQTCARKFAENPNRRVSRCLPDGGNTPSEKRLCHRCRNGNGNAAF